MNGELLLWQKFCAELAKELDCLSIDEGVLAAVKALKAQLAEANTGLNNLAKRLCLNHAATMCGERNQRNDGKCETCEMQAKMAACEWKPITETDLPKGGDEAVGRDKTSVFIDGSFRIILRSVSDATVKLKMDDWNRLGYYHFRAINPPQQGKP